MTELPVNQLNLVADIGGTNTRVALADGTRLLPDTIAKFANRDHSDLMSVLHDYLARQGEVDCAGACVAVAGPVHDGVGRLTNLDWTIDRETLARAARAEKVAILNDLQAQGHALGHLEEASLSPLLAAPEPSTSSQAVRLVIGVGTGFNAAAVFDTALERLVPPSETGHSVLPVRDELDEALFNHLRLRHGFPSIEDILSGRGLERLFAWHSAQAGENLQLGAAAIMELIRAGADETAIATAAHFSRIFGNVAGNLALINLPFGGIYLAGGVARAIAPHLNDHGFAQAFRDKGRFSTYMNQFPVSVIENDWAALIGGAHHLNALPG